MSVCAKHRHTYGEFCRPRTACQYPAHQGRPGRSQKGAKSRYSVNLEMTKAIKCMVFCSSRLRCVQRIVTFLHTFCYITQALKHFIVFLCQIVYFSFRFWYGIVFLPVRLCKVKVQTEQQRRRQNPWKVPHDCKWNGHCKRNTQVWDFLKRLGGIWYRSLTSGKTLVRKKIQPRLRRICRLLPQ